MNNIVKMDAENPLLLANYGHFLLTYQGDRGTSSLQLFERALKADPVNIQCMLWYAKALKRCKKYGQVQFNINFLRYFQRYFKIIFGH